MPKHWTEIDEDELLNFEGPETAKIARYERISEARTRHALESLEKQLAEQTAANRSATDRLVGVGNHLIRAIESGEKSQSRHQKAIFWLTIVIAGATVAYTVITWVSVQAMRESNRIQMQEISQPSEDGPHNQSLRGKPTLCLRN